MKWLKKTAFIMFFLMIILNASVMKYRSIESMTKEASLIVRSKVESIVSKWDQSKTIIKTYTKLRPELVLKGSNSTEFITIETLGGEIGDEGLRVTGEARFTKGEDVLVFLRKDKKITNEEFIVVGMTQGKFTILKTSDTKLAVKRDFSDIKLINR